LIYGQYALINPIAVLTDSFITSPNIPVISHLPLPSILTVSIINTFPPAAVQANPLLIPGYYIYGLLNFSENILGPIISVIKSLSITNF